MKRLLSAIPVVFLLTLVYTFSYGQTKYNYDVWSTSADTLRGVVEGKRNDLNSSFIVPGSERVFLGTYRLSRNEYQINYRLGVIRINIALPAVATVVVAYQRSPFVLDPVYALREANISEPGSGDTLTVAAPSRVKKTRPEPAAGNLVFGGTKSISFTVGNNRGTALDQSLQASVEGQLTPTIKVKALLSDNNLPVQPEGNTEELEYLDQVYVEIEGSNARATLGDFGFDNSISTFSPFTRQLKGIRTEAWIDRGKILLAGAQSKGEFKSFETRGTTGLQGPYELLSASRNTGEVVIAGTERVYVNGARLKRGRNRDYTIDYDEGSVTFTPGVLITNDTEIAVDFEVTQQRYERSTVFAAVETRILPGGLNLDVVFARERDNKSSPKNQTFTDAELAILRGAGDDATRALTSGVTPADSGFGDYAEVPADSVSGVPRHFVFADSAGDYNVSFVEAGPGMGDYELGGISSRGRRYYRFTGAGGGNYKVGKFLPLPETVSLVTARLRRGQGKHIGVDAEWNVSEHDKNLFSGVDDGDNTGGAGRCRLSVENLPVGFGRLGFSGSFDTIEEQFKSFDKARPSFYYRDWNLENVELAGREIIQEYTAGFDRGKSAELKYKLGTVERDGVDGIKHEGNARIGQGEDRVVTCRAFDTETRRVDEVRTRNRATGSVSYGLWKFRPSFVYDREKYVEDSSVQPDSGIAYELFRVRFADRSAKNIDIGIEAENRETREITSDLFSGARAWNDSRRDRTFSVNLAVRGQGSVQGDLQFTHREEKNRIHNDERTADLARLKGFIRSASIGFRADVDYEISQTAARTLTRSVVYVGDGKGDYNAQGDLVGKSKGDYTVVFSPTTSAVPTNRVNFNFRTGWKKPRKRGGMYAGLGTGRNSGEDKGSGDGNDGADGDNGAGVWSWIVANVALDQTVTVTEESTYDPAWKIYAMIPSALQRNETTVFGTVSVRQDWTFLESYPSVSLTYRYQRRDEEDNRFDGINEQRYFGQHLMRLSRSLSSLLSATGEISREVRRRSGDGINGGSGGVYDIDALAVLGGVGLRIRGGSSIDADVKVTDQEDRVSTSRQTLLTLRPKVTWRITKAISVFGSYDLTRAWDLTDVDTKPVVFSNEGESHRWSVTPTVRLSKHISLVATYFGRRETVFSGKRITDHELKVETRAFF